MNMAGLMFPLPSEGVHTQETLNTECGSISPQRCTAFESRWIYPTSELPCPCPHRRNDSAHLISLTGEW